MYYRGQNTDLVLVWHDTGWMVGYISVSVSHSRLSSLSGLCCLSRKTSSLKFDYKGKPAEVTGMTRTVPYHQCHI